MQTVTMERPKVDTGLGMGYGIDEKFDRLISGIADTRITDPREYDDRYDQTDDYRSAFFTEEATRKFVGLLTHYQINKQDAYCSLGAVILHDLNISLETYRYLILADALTNGVQEYTKVHGHKPVSMQNFCAACMAYGRQDAITLGDIY